MKTRDSFSIITARFGCALLGAILATGAMARAGTDDKDVKNLDTSNSVAPTTGSIWQQQYLTGDWGGERTRLEQEGILLTFEDRGDFLTDVTGGQTHHATYFGRFRASADFNFKKLADVDSELFVTSIYQYGRNLSGDYLHTNTLTSSIAGEESLRIDQLWYKQWFADHMASVTFGQMAAVNEFGATDFFDILFNDELGYAPNALFSPRQPFSPAGKPGIVFYGDLSDITKGLYVKVGAFTAYDNSYRPDSNGVDYKDDFNHGMTVDGEIGYIEPKTDYAGVYKLGFNGGSGTYLDPQTGILLRDDYNIYGQVEKTVFHPIGTDGRLDTKKGLDLLFEVVGAPGDRNALEYEGILGARYTGLIPGREADKIGVGLIYSENSNAYSNAYRAINGHGLGGETTAELDYQFNPAPWLSIQPDLQYIVDPGGDSHRSDILVLGLRTIVEF